MNIFRVWFGRLSSNPQLVTLILMLFLGGAVVLIAGKLVGPLLAAVVLAYLLDGPVGWLQKCHVPRPLGAAMVSITLLLSVAWVGFLLMPLLTRQAVQIIQELPSLIDSLQTWVMELPSRYPAVITHGQIEALIGNMSSVDLGGVRKALLSRSIMLGTGLFIFAIYLVLVPLMVFFMLRDKYKLLAWVARYMPYNNALLVRVWHDVNMRLTRYIRGLALEILIVWAVAYMVFSAFGLDYAILLSALMGFSVLVPYFGAFSMIIPVALVAYAQWGMSLPTLWILVAYIAMQMLDGNVLVPLLFSGAVSLHPVAIMTAILFFGGIWGFWGVFFAIPLATVVNSVLKAWPRVSDQKAMTKTVDE